MRTPSKITCAMRMMHIDNLSGIVEHGILCRSSFASRGDDYTPIGYKHIINRRAVTLIPGTDIAVGDCVAFYFGPKTPMLFNIQFGNGGNVYDAEEIVYCVVKIERLRNLQCPIFFTDGNASSHSTCFYLYQDLDGLNQIVNVKRVYEERWGRSYDSTGFCLRKKQAELLVYSDIPFNLVSYVVVYSNQAKYHAISQGVPQNMIFVRPEFYF